MDNVFKIIARDPSGSGLAYAEKIMDYVICDDGLNALVTGMDNNQWFADIADIVINPVVIKSIAGGHLFKIELYGGELYAKDF